ncbi:MAG: glycosyltransferase [Pseudomonadota bacterium]
MRVSPRKFVRSVIGSFSKRVPATPEILGRPAAWVDLTPLAEDRLSALWDEDWYRNHYADLTHLDIDLWDHFLSHGMREGRSPNKHFDPNWYFSFYSDLHQWTNSALEHYLLHGLDEGRNPSADFNAAWYGTAHPDSVSNPLAHYLKHGQSQSLPINEVADILSMRPDLKGLDATTDDIAEGAAIDVIIPVYRGLEDTKRCIESLIKWGIGPVHNIIVINDCSPEPEITDYLREVAAADDIILLENEDNLGFVGSVDRGMRYSSSNDVVLLNSDTEVPAGWLEKLAWHARNDKDVATVTPFSNNATI